MTDSLLIEDRGAVRVLSIDRPARRNALDVETVGAIADAVLEAGRTSSVRSIVLTGVGDHFSAGGDASVIVDAIEDPADDSNLDLMRTFHRAVEAIWSSKLPVIAAVEGAAFGGSFNVVLGCDLVVAAENARFCQVFLKRNVMPDLGGGFLLPRLVGLQRAKELIFRTTEISAAEGKSMGFVNDVVPAGGALEAAVAWGAELAELSPVALQLSKKLLNESTGLTMQSSLALEAAYQSFVLDTSAAAEGFAPFRKK